MFKTLIKRVQIEKTNNAKQKIVVVVEKVVVVSKIIVFSNIVVFSTIVVFLIVVVVASKFINQQKLVVDSKIDEFIFKKLRIDINFQLISKDIIYYIKLNINRLCILNIVKKKYFN